MAKNLKINIKNTQLAEALNLNELKANLSKNKGKNKKETAPASSIASTPTATPAATTPEEEPRRIKARSKSTPPAEIIEQAPSVLESELNEQAAAPTDTPTIEPSDQLTTQSPISADIEEPQNMNVPLPKVEESTTVTEIPPTTFPKKESSSPQFVTPKSHETKKQESQTRYPSSHRPSDRSAESRPPHSAYRPPSDRFSNANRSPHSIRTPHSEGQRPPSAPHIKLGPTGRHVKDLVYIPKKPKDGPSTPPPGNLPPSEKEDSRRHKNAHATPLKGKEPLRKGESPSEAPGEAAKRAAKAKEFKDVKPLRKQEGMRSFDARDRQGLRESDDENWRKRRTLKAQRIQQEDITIRPNSLKIRVPITVKELADKMKLKGSQLIAKLFMQGVVITINDALDDETTLQLLGQEFGCEISIDTAEEERLRITDKSIIEEVSSTDPSLLQIRAPVVTFMGHVDHGKTSLIDAIRKSNRVATEAGAITQHIGAFMCQTAVGNLTILDTPGHEAFSAMRQRGANATDIVVLVIAGDEGMKQQTIEAINQAKDAKVTIVVAINKSDKPNFNVENVYKQLAEQNLLPEAWGGTTITINCSAVSGEGIKELLEMLALQAEMLELKASPQARARGTVLESEMHKGLGTVATILVQNGTLRKGDAIVFDQHFGRVKNMRNEHGRDLEVAGPSTPVEITGLSGLPEAGDEFIVVKDEKEARHIAEGRQEGKRQLALQQSKRFSMDKLSQPSVAAKKILNVIIKADVQGSIEALRVSLQKIKSTKVELNIVNIGVGEISESDIQLAAASSAIVIGFHTMIEAHAEDLIKQLGVGVHLFDVIYHAIDSVRDLMKGLLDKIEEEKDLGTAEVKAVFKSSHLGLIAGCMVTEGVIQRNQRIRVIREGQPIWKGSISSLKRVKEDVREVKKDFECGILLNGFTDVKEGDFLQSYEVIYLTQEL